MQRVLSRASALLRVSPVALRPGSKSRPNDRPGIVASSEHVDERRASISRHAALLIARLTFRRSMFSSRAIAR
jgi:hypothetical protein